MIESLLAHGIWVAILFIIIGFVALVKGADCLVDGASSIAKRFGISHGITPRVTCGVINRYRAKIIAGR